MRLARLLFQTIMELSFCQHVIQSSNFVNASSGMEYFLALGEEHLEELALEENIFHMPPAYLLCVIVRAFIPFVYSPPNWKSQQLKTTISNDS